MTHWGAPSISLPSASHTSSCLLLRSFLGVTSSSSTPAYNLVLILGDKDAADLSSSLTFHFVACAELTSRLSNPSLFFVANFTCDQDLLLHGIILDFFRGDFFSKASSLEELPLLLPCPVLYLNVYPGARGQPCFYLSVVTYDSIV